MNTQLFEAVLALRGKTIRDRTGLIVTTMDGESAGAADWAAFTGASDDRIRALAGDRVLVLPGCSADAVGDMDGFAAERGGFPAAVVFGREGVSFPARDLDTARQNAAAFFSALASGSRHEMEPPALPGPASRLREDVVRGKISVVTGGAQGFGAELARLLVDAGSLCFICDINENGAAELSDELNRRSGTTVARPVKIDVTSEESVEAAVRTIVREAGGMDLFISNAGVLKAGSVKEMSLSEFEFVTDVNYRGYFLCVKHVARAMSVQNRTGEGNLTDIIQINSKSGLEGSNKNGAYAGGKFGGIGLTQSFALELIADGIKVNSICPGNFFEGPLWSDPDRGLFVQYLNAGKVPGARTIAEVRRFYEEKVPMGRGCTGLDVIRAVYYIVEQEYETGQAVPVTGGQVMLN